MTTGKNGRFKIKLFRFRPDAQPKRKSVYRFGRRVTQSEMVDNAFREATKRTGTFAGKHAK